MKDFQEVIDECKEKEPVVPAIKKEEHGVYRKYIEQILPYVSPFLLSIVTGPLNTASIFLQVTAKGASSASLYQTKIKAQPNLERHILNGVFGDNKIYEPPKVAGYSDAFKRLGREGIKGFYKGNLTGVFLASGNAWIKSQLYRQLGERGVLGEGLTSHIMTVAICTLTDLITLPLMSAQSRLVLQNSSSHFRTYKSAFSVWKSVPKATFTGGSVLLLKNILFELSWIQLFPASPSSSFMVSTALSHLATYPFFVVMRQMQTADPKAPMMQNRSENIRACVSRLWGQGGVRSFYRGFLAHSGVHLFMGALMLQANMRSGFFIQ